MSSPGEALAETLRARLPPLGTTERAVHEKAYLKSELRHLGVNVPVTRKTAKRALKEAGKLPKSQLLAAVRSLWADPVYEHRSAAAELLVASKKRLAAEDLPQLEVMLREARTWALVDHLAVQLVGHLLGQDASRVELVLDRWALDEDLWIRRSALLALLPGLRAKDGDFQRFSRYADVMLPETEFFIRKAIGWVLRERSAKCPEQVHAWMIARVANMSGLTMREGSRKLPADMRDQVKAAWNGRASEG